MWLLADIDPAGLAGTSGWVGAGLLGLVLAWLLLVHLPKQDEREDKRQKDWAERMDAKDKVFTDCLTAKDAKHETIIKITTDHCEKQLDIITSHFLAEIRGLLGK